jgi:hypothetical protein
VDEFRPPKAKRRRKNAVLTEDDQQKAKKDQEVRDRMLLRAKELDKIVKSTSHIDQLQIDVANITEEYSATKILPFKSQISCFKAIVTYLHHYLHISEKLIHNFTIHEFVSAYAKYQTGLSSVTIEIETSLGKHQTFT